MLTISSRFAHSSGVGSLKFKKPKVRYKSFKQHLKDIKPVLGYFVCKEYTTAKLDAAVFGHMPHKCFKSFKEFCEDLIFHSKIAEKIHLCSITHWHCHVKGLFPKMNPPLISLYKDEVLDNCNWLQGEWESGWDASHKVAVSPQVCAKVMNFASFAI